MLKSTWNHWKYIV